MWSRRAEAASQIPIELEWQAPEDECPSQAALVEQIAKLVERHPSSARPVRARAEVERLPNQRYRVRLTTEAQGAQGSRVLEARTCQALGDLVVLILAWMIQPELSGEPPAKVEAPEPPPPAPPQRVRAAPRRSEWSLSLRAAGDLGSLPKPGLGGSLSVSYRVERLQLSLQGSYFPRSRAQLAPVAGFTRTGGDFSLITASLLGCFEPTPARVGLCAGPELSRERGEGFGVSSPSSGDKTWLSLAAGLRSSLHLGGPLWLEASAEAVLPTLREEFVLDGVGPVHRPSALIARASLGIGLTL